MLKIDRSVRNSSAERLKIFAVTLALVAASIAIGLFHRIEARAQSSVSDQSRNAADAGLPQNGIAGGVESGIDRGVAGGIDRGITGGASGGIRSGSEAIEPEAQDNKASGETQRPGKWELIEQAPEYFVRIENQNDSPLVITDARVRVKLDDEGQANRSGQIADSIDVIIAQFSVTLFNQTDRPVRGLVLEFKNKGLLGITRIGVSGDTRIEPHGYYDFGKKMLHHHMAIKGVTDMPSRFAVKVVGVKFDKEPHWGTFAKSPSGVEPTSGNQLNDRAQDDAEIDDLTDIGSSSIRPVILERKKADYTPEARNNRIEGSVALSVIFRSDGVVAGIKVVRGLPDGLTEKAIEAARKIRFVPAIKDGEPVSVRAALEYWFSL
jgi:TonB family protein